MTPTLSLYKSVCFFASEGSQFSLPKKEISSNLDISHRESAKFRASAGVAGDTSWGVAGEIALGVTDVGVAGEVMLGVTGEEM